jgi:hypothetical protein
MAQKSCSFKRKHTPNQVPGPLYRDARSPVMQGFGTMGPRANGVRMSDRSWFFAADGKQQGPYPEAQFRDFLTGGAISADTLVWTEGLAGWLRAGEIPGLLDGGASPPTPSRSGDGSHIDPLSLDVGVWPLLGRSLMYVIGIILVVTAPWAGTNFYRWITKRLRVPGRPDLAFTGQVGDIWYVLLTLGLCSYVCVRLPDNYVVQFIFIPIDAFLSWIILRWLLGNLSSAGQRHPISFEGSAPGYLGWSLLLYLSFITIIGWAWVITAWMRWICRKISGTRREVTFDASGSAVLWRTLLFAIGCAFLIPAPWVLCWYATWFASQFGLVERGVGATA